MKLLLLNTCGTEGSIALADTERRTPVVVSSAMPGRTASERLVAVVREAMATARWKLQELDAVGVVTGPGSFTGVRVGLSAAKGLSEAIGLPMIAVSRLAMLAAAAGSNPGRVCALLDAGREEFYCGEYAGGVELLEALVSPEDAASAVGLADAAVICEESVARALRDTLPLRMVAEPDAADALPFARRRFEAGLFDDPVTVDAHYLRRTDAEIFAKPAVRSVG